MILGKRPRPPIKRTTSMTEFTLDHNHTAAAVPAASNNPSPPYDPNNPFNIINPLPDGNSTTTTTLDHRLSLTATVSPRNLRRNSADHMESPHFLTSCHLCRRRLITGRDIFMYRGDRAFCSFECRQQQMNEDEKKDGRSTLISKKLSETVNNEYSSDTSKID